MNPHRIQHVDACTTGSFPHRIRGLYSIDQLGYAAIIRSPGSG